jgi:hypothetical protein
MRMMASINKTTVTTAIQEMLRSSQLASIEFNISCLVTMTAWTRGRKARAIVCAGGGREARGKKVPLSSNMGVINRKLA